MPVILLAVSYTASVVLTGAFVAGLLGLLWRRERARGRLARLARGLQLNYTPVDAHGLHRRFRGLELFRQGHNRYLFDIISGSTRLGTVHCFRYRYERGFGVERCTYRWVVVVLQLARPVGDCCVRHPELPDGQPGRRLDRSDGADFALAPEQVAAAAAPSGELKTWYESLAFPTALECRYHLISLQVVDDGSDAQYEGLLEAIQQGGGRVLSTEC